MYKRQVIKYYILVVVALHMASLTSRYDLDLWHQNGNMVLVAPCGITGIWDVPRCLIPDRTSENHTPFIHIGVDTGFRNVPPLASVGPLDVRHDLGRVRVSHGRRWGQTDV